MWTNMVEGTTFLQQLYDTVPSLEQVEIIKWEWHNRNDNLTLHILLTQPIDHIPPKWAYYGYDAVIMELDLFYILEATFHTKHHTQYQTNLSIQKQDADNICVRCEGAVQFCICAECAMIQKLHGCRKGEIQTEHI